MGKENNHPWYGAYTTPKLVHTFGNIFANSRRRKYMPVGIRAGGPQVLQPHSSHIVPISHKSQVTSHSLISLYFVSSLLLPVAHLIILFLEFLYFFPSYFFLEFLWWILSLTYVPTYTPLGIKHPHPFGAAEFMATSIYAQP